MLVAIACAAASAAQRVLSTPMRQLRRSVSSVEGRVRLRDGTDVPLDAAQRGVQASHEVLNDGENLAARGAVSQGHDLLEIYPAQQIAVDRGL